MTRRMLNLLALPLALLLLAGCASGPSDVPPEESAIVVQAPDDYSYLGQDDPWSRPHLHDYWGGKTQHTLMSFTDTWHGDVYLAPLGYFTNGYYPEDGRVVPQGTGHLSLNITFAPEPGDRHGVPALWYRSPAMADFSEAIPLDSPAVLIPVGPDEADLPHNSLSGWLFKVGMQADSTGVMRFTGAMRMEVVALRERDIPVFPGHPDLWQRRSEIELFSGKGTTSAQTGPSGLCTPLPPEMGCPTRWRPADGSIVPYDASYIEVRLDVSLSPRGLALAYHGADTRALTILEPAEQAGTVQVYQVPVQGNGDSPYARQSLWEFLAVGKGDRTIEHGSYTIEASVFKAPPLTPA